MLTEIAVPDIGDFKNVEIIEVLVKPGDAIKKNDPIVTLESDKSSVEVPSPLEGKISSIKVKIGDKVSQGSVIALIEANKKIEKKIIETSKKIESIKQKPDVLPETEKIIKQAESTVAKSDKKEKTKKVHAQANGADIDPIETKEWLDSLDAVISKDGPDRAHYLLRKLIDEAYKEGSNRPLTRITPVSYTHLRAHET